ncbi:HAD family phosphatase [Glutamicibacter protophormiae]|uniref:HAD family hydrolase n=1 Tax=Glutamicibacter protophormiae TaxID=37930 RepID=UPI002A836F7C|nr:HAD family phosphatase [Glutamicibacter protophormiae]WPR66339.1 HAD family phosphatase [Glutamicibacter protophormiae]WPR69835.1 HAD family phosphatase [Glutamicibacter protophormiae]
MPSTSFAFDTNLPPEGPHAVLWDMDGTLIDTEPYWIAAEGELVAAHGGTWSEEQAHALVGSALPDAARVLQAAGVQLRVREIIEKLGARVAAGIRERMPWRPGALELLTGLHAAGVPQALVTMSERSVVDELLPLLPAGIFQATVTGEEVTRGKPHPEPYLRGLRLLSELAGAPLDPARCIGLEDSAPGIAAASAAGLHAVLIPNATDPGAGPWRRVDSLSGVDLRVMAAWLAQVNA